MAHNFNEFISVLNKHNIIAIVVASVMSEKINETTTLFVESILIPLCGSKKKLENKVVHVGKSKIHIGRFLLVFLKCLLVIYIIYLISVILKKKV